MHGSNEPPRRVVVERNGPLLVEGPVEVTTAEGKTVVSERFVVAICTCRRSRIHPWCDTSHRRRKPAAEAAESADGVESVEGEGTAP